MLVLFKRRIKPVTFFFFLLGFFLNHSTKLKSRFIEKSIIVFNIRGRGEVNEIELMGPVSVTIILALFLL